MSSKICIRCGKEKTVENFPAGRNVCHACRSVKARQRYAENPSVREKAKAKDKKRYAENRDAILETHRKRRPLIGDFQRYLWHIGNYP